MKTFAIEEDRHELIFCFNDDDSLEISYNCMFAIGSVALKLEDIPYDRFKKAAKDFKDSRLIVIYGREYDLCIIIDDNCTLTWEAKMYGQVTMNVVSGMMICNEDKFLKCLEILDHNNI